jgi:hypothetical protein
MSLGSISSLHQFYDLLGASGYLIIFNYKVEFFGRFKLRFRGF